MAEDKVIGGAFSMRIGDTEIKLPMSGLSVGSPQVAQTAPAPAQAVESDGFPRVPLTPEAFLREAYRGFLNRRLSVSETIQLESRVREIFRRTMIAMIGRWAPHRVDIHYHGQIVTTFSTTDRELAGKLHMMKYPVELIAEETLTIRGLAQWLATWINEWTSRHMNYAEIQWLTDNLQRQRCDEPNAVFHTGFDDNGT